jgi:hypothetical protein
MLFTLSRFRARQHLTLYIISLKMVVYHVQRHLKGSESIVRYLLNVNVSHFKDDNIFVRT